MPTKPPRVCNKCREPFIDTRCPRCYVAWDKTTVHPMSTHQGRKLRDRVRREEPICRLCRQRLTQEIDHIVPVSVDPSLSFVRSNLQGLCKLCHEAKTITERNA